ncbi:unnamed protein product, partial [Laminaria digitata]
TTRARAHQCYRVMEYERALFRVYDKSMEGFRSPGVKSACNLAQKFFLVTAAGLFAALVLLHRQFVNNPGCLGALLEEAARAEGVLIPASSPSGVAVRADGSIIDSITANNTKGTIEISDDGAIIDPGRGEGTVSGDAAGEEGEGESQEEEEEDENGDDNDNHPTRIRMPSGAWMPYDVMVGVSIGSGHGGGGGGGAGTAAMLEGNGSVVAVNGTSFMADYTFAFEPIVLLLPAKLQQSHDFQWVNFTVEPSVCLKGAGLVSRVLAATVIGYDVIMVNMFMFTMKSKGLL